jgi:integrase
LELFVTVLNFGIHNKYLESYDTKIFRMKVLKSEGDRIYLTQEEIEKLKDLSPGMERTRDLLLMQCYTGLRYSDIRQFKKHHLQDGYIKMVMQKTRKKNMVPVSERAAKLLDKYVDKPEHKNGLLNAKHVNNQNPDLKELGKLAKLDEQIEVTRFIGNRRIVEMRHKWELLTTHTGRRSFATNYILKGGKVEQLCTLLGHTDIRTTQKYLRHSPDVIAAIAREYML